MTYPIINISYSIAKYSQENFNDALKNCENLVRVDVDKCGLCSLPTDASGIMFYFKCVIDHIKRGENFFMGCLLPWNLMFSSKR